MVCASAASSQRFRAGGVLGGVRGGAMHRQRQAPARGRRIALSWAMHLYFLFSAGAGGDPQGGCPAPSAIIFGVQGYASTTFYPVPVGNTGTSFKKSR